MCQGHLIAKPRASVALEMQVWQRDIKALQWSVELQDAYSIHVALTETVFRMGSDR